jgi:Cu/Ag efflux pump CusA
MHWVGKPGTSLDAMRRTTARVSRELRAIPGVRNFGSHIGRAEVADEVVGPNFTELWISLDPEVDYAPPWRASAPPSTATRASTATCRPTSKSA